MLAYLGVCDDVGRSLIEQARREGVDHGQEIAMGRRLALKVTDRAP